MKPSVWAMFWIVVAIIGWLITQAGFPPVDGDPAFELSEAARRPLRLGGTAVLFAGAAGAALSGLRGPLALLIAGVGVNIAAEAGVLAPHHLGILGVLAAFAGCLWASRQIRNGAQASE